MTSTEWADVPNIRWPTNTASHLIRQHLISIPWQRAVSVRRQILDRRLATYFVVWTRPVCLRGNDNRDSYDYVIHTAINSQKSAGNNSGHDPQNDAC